MSLAVKDIAASAAFYEKLGFTSFGGDITQNWLILKNGETVIGLFQGMFEKNMLTFNTSERQRPARAAATPATQWPRPPVHAPAVRG